MTQDTQVTAPEAESGSPPDAPFTAPQDAAPEAPSAPETETPTEPETPEPNWDEVWDHDELKPRRKAIQETAHREGHLQGMQEAVSATDESSQEFGKLNRQVGALLGRLNKAASDGTLDAASVSQLLSEHQETFFVLNKALDKELHGQYGHAGYSELLKEIGDGLEDASLLADFEKRLPLAARRIDKGLAKDVRQWLTRTVAASAEKKGYERGLKEGKAFKATKQQVKDAKNNPQGALVPDTGGGGTKPYSKMTSEERSKLTSAERDAAVEREGGIWGQQ
jgi:hypothetical protein